MSSYFQLEKKAFENIPTVAKNALQFDKIHIEKVMEMTYYMALAFGVSLVISAGINKSMKPIDRKSVV